jgi:hypothetical protein
MQSPASMRCLLHSVLLIWFLAVVLNTAGQPAFSRLEQERADFVSYSFFPTYAGGMSFSDFNDDGWDDMTLTTDFGRRVHFYQNHFGAFKETFPLFTYLTKQSFAVWIDYDNDGDKDFFSFSEMGGMQLFKNNSGTFVDATFISGLINQFTFLRGGVFGDFNNDGLLDLYVCEYNLISLNHMFFQDSNHVFQDVTTVSGTGNGFKRTFQGVVLDYNNDGLLDLYLSNDIFDGNTLYRNNGDSTFSDVSNESGTYVEMESMGLAVGDFDGDLDLDIHITDRVTDSKLFRNNNDGTFTEVGTEMGVDFNMGFGWGNNFFDADLDGDEDLYVVGVSTSAYTTTPSALYINNTSGPFTSTNLPGDTLYSFSSVLGDFNNDRLTDIAVHNSWHTESVVWQNTTSVLNDAIKIELEGCSSNKDAIGSLVYAYSNGIPRLYSVHGSQSFLGQSSERIIIPLVNAPILDSLIVKWPLGYITTLYNIQPRQTLLIKECDLPEPAPVILVPNYNSQGLTICSNDSILLTLDGEYPNVQWSSGETSDSIFVTSAGVYSLTVTNQFGVSEVSSPISIIERQYPDITVESELSSCFNNGSIQIHANDSNSLYEYNWSNGETAEIISNLSPGVYHFTITDQGDCAIEDSVVIDGPTNFTPIKFNGSSENALCFNESSGILSVSPTGGTAPFQYLWSNQDTTATINVHAGNYRLTVSDNYNCKRDTTFKVDEPDQILAHIDVHPDSNMSGIGMISLDVFGGTPPYTIQWSDDQNQTGSIAQNLTAGNYFAQITDANLCNRSLEIKVPNIDLTGASKLLHEACELNCINRPSSILVEFTESCLQPASLEQLEVFNMQGQHINFTSRQISSTKMEIVLDVTGVFLIREHTGKTCKLLRVNRF